MKNLRLDSVKSRLWYDFLDYYARKDGFLDMDGVYSIIADQWGIAADSVRGDYEFWKNKTLSKLLQEDTSQSRVFE